MARRQDDDVVSLTTRIGVPVWLIILIPTLAWWAGCHLGQDAGRLDGWHDGFQDSEKLHDQSEKRREKERQEQQDARDRAVWSY